MKRVSVIFAILIVAALVMGCKSSPASTSAGPATQPEWLNEKRPADVLWGIGIAKQSDPSMAMEVSENRARVSIARQLDSRVKAMFIDYNLEAGSSGAQANASMQERISRTITNTNVTGAQPIKRWQAPDGTWWTLVEFSKSDARNTVASILNSEEAQFAQFKASLALQKLDAELAKDEKPVVVDN